MTSTKGGPNGRPAYRYFHEDYAALTKSPELLESINLLALACKNAKLVNFLDLVRDRPLKS